MITPAPAAAHLGRRSFLASAVAACVSAKLVRWRPGDPPRTRLILLGTGGGPRPKKNAVSSSQVIIINDAAYVIDCGDGVARQLVLADVPLTSLRHIFITHHHSDHNADYGNLLLLSWGTGLRTRVDTWGPPPLTRITRLFFEMSAPDIEVRIADEGRVPLEPLVFPHEITASGIVMQDANVKVTAAVVPHPMMPHAFAYRFDSADRSIVISGDTAPSEAMVKLAKDADVLVHEAILPEGIDRLAARVPNAATLKRHLSASHTSAEEVGRIAQEAGVKHLVLSHFVPPDDPLLTEPMWHDAAARHFTGKITVGHDLQEI